MQVTSKESIMKSNQEDVLQNVPKLPLGRIRSNIEGLSP
jgi:hypothetical protein